MNYIKTREKDPSDKTNFPTADIIRYLQRSSSELEEYSHMAMVSLLRNASIVELFSRKRKNTATFTYTNCQEIEDPYQMGFYFLLKGRCNLVFEVLKLRKAEDVSCAQSEQEGSRPDAVDEEDLNNRTSPVAQEEGDKE